MTLPQSTMTTPGLSITFADTSDWGTGFIGGVTITNTSSAAISNWTISFALADAISNVWNAALVSSSSGHYTLSNLSYNGTIAPGASVNFGFQAAGASPIAPSSYVFNGKTVSGSSGTAILPALSIAGASVTEGSAASLPETFTLTLSAAATTPVTVAYQTVDGTAHAGTDYTAASGSVTFKPGQTMATVTVATKPGSAGTKTYALQLSSASGATLAQSSATGTIIDPQPLPQITAANVSVQESTITTTGTGTGTGSTLLPSGYLSTSGNQIVSANGTPVKIAAVNWYGFETNAYAPQGLWAENYKTMMNQMVSLGFNAIRLPFSLQLFDAGSTPSGINYALNPDLAGLNGLGIMDKIVAYANQIGLKIILDNHRSAAGSGPNDNGLWYDDGYTAQDWINTWTMLAQHYAGNTTVIGADLLDEPHGPATWGDGSADDWAAAATQAGDAIQAVNPNWLVMVEGIQTYDGESTWWGGNLMGVASHPITLTDANKLVYSPHDYPASVYDQSWFNAANYPNNLPAVWTQNWGYIYQDDIAPVFLGEFGSKLQTTSDQEWIASLINYIDAPGGAGGAEGISWAYWDWNPTSGDTGGILEDDWSTVDQTKINAIAPAFYHAGSATSGGTTVSPDVVDFVVKLSAASATPVTVDYKTADGTAKAGVNYVAQSGTLTFAPGDTTAIVETHLLGSSAVTSNLTFMLDLSSPSGASLGTTAATATLTPTNTGTTTSTGTTGSTTPPPTALSVIAHATQSWSGGFLENLTIENTGAAAVSDWEIALTMPGTISNLWNAVNLGHSGDTYLLGNAVYNAEIPAHGSITIGFQAAGSAGDPLSAVLFNPG